MLSSPFWGWKVVLFFYLFNFFLWYASEFGFYSSFPRKDNDHFWLDILSRAEGAATLSVVLTFSSSQESNVLFLFSGSKNRLHEWLSLVVFRSLPLYIIPCNSLCGGCSELSVIVWRLQGSPEKSEKEEHWYSRQQSRKTFSQQWNLSQKEYETQYLNIQGTYCILCVHMFVHEKHFLIHLLRSF